MHYVNNSKIVTEQFSYLKLSVHHLCSLLLGFFPSTSPLITFFVVLSLLISFSLFFHFCLLFTTSKIPSWPSLILLSSFLTLSTLLTPSILLNTLIRVAWTCDSCCFDRFHTSHPYTSVGNMVAFVTFNLHCIRSNQ